jgi:hypothetical protein
MTAVHIQLREDAALGAAWRRCEAALPEGSVLSLDLDTFLQLLPPYDASVRNGHDTVLGTTGQTPTEALEALAEALEARKAAE